MDTRCKCLNRGDIAEDVAAVQSMESGDDANSVGIIEHTSNKEYPINMERFCTFFLNQQIFRDEPCSHVDMVCVTKQRRCNDEMETVILTCRSCGRIQNK